MSQEIIKMFSQQFSKKMSLLTQQGLGDGTKSKRVYKARKKSKKKKR
jgi:hypothetical protein